MEAYTDLGIALFGAAVLISLFAILRVATRSPSSPEWLTHMITAYAFAVVLTVATAASFLYLGYALQPFVGVALGALGSIGVHTVLLAVFRMVLPVSDADVVPARRAAPAKTSSRPSNAVAA